MNYHGSSYPSCMFQQLYNPAGLQEQIYDGKPSSLGTKMQSITQTAIACSRSQDIQKDAILKDVDENKKPSGVISNRTQSGMLFSKCTPKPPGLLSVTATPPMVPGCATATPVTVEHHKMNGSLADSQENSFSKILNDSFRKKADLLASAGRFSSVYRGVTKHRTSGRFEAHYWDSGYQRPTCSDKDESNPKLRKFNRKRGRQIYCGAYASEIEAARAYDKIAIAYAGDAAVLNFPLEDYLEYCLSIRGKSKEEVLTDVRRKSAGFARGKTKYRGVSVHCHGSAYEARIRRGNGGKTVYLGLFPTAEEAARAYDRACIASCSGKSAQTLNFPISDYKNLTESFQTTNEKVGVYGSTPLSVGRKRKSKSLILSADSKRPIQRLSEESGTWSSTHNQVNTNTSGLASDFFPTYKGNKIQLNGNETEKSRLLASAHGNLASSCSMSQSLNHLSQSHGKIAWNPSFAAPFSQGPQAPMNQNILQNSDSLTKYPLNKVDITGCNSFSSVLNVNNLKQLSMEMPGELPPHIKWMLQDTKQVHGTQQDCGMREFNNFRDSIAQRNFNDFETKKGDQIASEPIKTPPQPATVPGFPECNPHRSEDELVAAAGKQNSLAPLIPPEEKTSPIAHALMSPARPSIFENNLVSEVLPDEHFLSSPSARYRQVVEECPPMILNWLQELDTLK